MSGATGDELSADALQALVSEDGARVDREEEDAAESAAFEAGFNGVGGETDSTAAAAAEADQADDRAEQEQQAAAQQPDGEAEGDKAKDGGDGEAPAGSDRLTLLEKRLRAVEGRNGTLIAQNRQLTQRIESLTAPAPEKAPSIAEMTAAAMAGGEKLKKLQDEFPEFADALAEQSRIYSETLDRHLVSVTGDRITKAEAKQMVEQAVGFATLEIKHPDWKQECAGEKFREWFMGQEADIQALAASDNPSDAIKMLDLYSTARKAARQEPPAASGEQLTSAKTADQNQHQAQDRLRAAVTATTGASRAPARGPSEEDDFVQGFNSVRG